MRIFFIFSVLILSVQLNLKAADLSSELDTVAKTLVSNYQTKISTKEIVTISILPFHTNKKLSKQRTGYALAELLTHSFRKYPNFKIVERIELNRIFDELKLNMSGIADPETAVKIGQLSGAKLEVFGSLEKIGSKYNINARMVETETGDIISTAYKSVRSDLFEKDAKHYMIPVPETQAIGFYVGYNFRNVKGMESFSYTYTCPYYGSTYTHHVNPKNLTLHLISVGIKYDPLKNIQLDFSVSLAGSKEMKKVVTTTYEYTNNTWSPFEKLRIYRFLISYKKKIGSKINSYYGLGFSKFTISNILGSSVSTLGLNYKLEYKPQERIALGIGASYDFVKQKLYYKNRKISEISQFSIEPTLSIYF